MGVVELQSNLITILNGDDINYYSDMALVESFIGEYLVVNGYKLTSFIVDDIPNNNRYMTIGFVDTMPDPRGYRFQLTITE